MPLFALNEIGYKRIIELSSLSYLNNDGTSDPHLNFEELLENNEGVAIFSGTIQCKIGNWTGSVLLEAKFSILFFLN